MACFLWFITLSSLFGMVFLGLIGLMLMVQPIYIKGIDYPDDDLAIIDMASSIFQAAGMCSIVFFIAALKLAQKANTPTYEDADAYRFMRMGGKEREVTAHTFQDLSGRSFTD